MADTIELIDLKAQYRALKPAIDARIAAVLDHGRYIMGPEIAELEDRLATYVDVPHCIGVASGTEALLIALMALDVGPGDEIITTPFTFASTAEVIAIVGATPVFVDIDIADCNIDASLIEAAITPKTKAIIPVSLYGQCADMDAINAIAERHDLIVIEDAAQSFGAAYKGRRSCGVSMIGCTSFFPSKPLGCYGDGGAIFTTDVGLAQIMREIRVHGQAKRYQHDRIGVGGRLDTIQAAVLLAKLDSFDAEVAARIAIGDRYLEMLGAMSGVRTIRVAEDRTSVWGQFTVLIEDRQRVAGALAAASIPTAIHYPIPLHRQTAYAGISRIAGSLENSEHAAASVLSLPMHPFIAADVQARIVDVLGGATAR
ncbi:UDP-2-acetamido-2-deoxy-ribo-hexuluronate aminotransferase [Sphingomonas jejuensis]|uniref:UDP-2-acetamido-2-deoxy-ribo-hexuluronate aminotransferase n=1 Tax=Sphingomonas jejuensis TaxID=904715 RepID=A0ABX0XLD5_9SPHN|nr:DegT/DnrJ/EryC1/StrS family aminotransferase [Sphingomonas jejuensis]NJC34182.1 UDP-2-acetamido-2-deoxy-ribo-hexuluronate aminotransferase [Sphingomonas jejuensis]